MRLVALSQDRRKWVLEINSTASIVLPYANDSRSLRQFSE